MAYPARARNVIGVAATTIRGCQADYSNSGIQVDLAAPGGGADAANSDTAYDAAVCRPDAAGPFIFQQTFTRSVRRFGLPARLRGHVDGGAPRVRRGGAGDGHRAAGQPTPARPTSSATSRATARDLGAPGFDNRYGNGLLDVAAALRYPAAPPARQLPKRRKSPRS